MGRKPRDMQDEEPEQGEQLQLIDVGPENLKKIKPVAKKYEAAKRRRMAAGEEESELKQQLLALVKEANLSRLPDGTIRFKVDHMTITVTPRDELVKVKDEDEDEED